jgi:hypothetical protein
LPLSYWSIVLSEKKLIFKYPVVNDPVWCQFSFFIRMMRSSSTSISLDQQKIIGFWGTDKIDVGLPPSRWEIYPSAPPQNQ